MFHIKKTIPYAVTHEIFNTYISLGLIGLISFLPLTFILIFHMSAFLWNQGVLPKWSIESQLRIDSSWNFCSVPRDVLIHGEKRVQSLRVKNAGIQAALYHLLSVKPEVDWPVQVKLIIERCMWKKRGYVKSPDSYTEDEKVDIGVWHSVRRLTYISPPPTPQSSHSLR